MNVGLHSRKTAVKRVDHIVMDIKNEIVTKIIEKNLKICVIVDEASTISNQPVVIIFMIYHQQFSLIWSNWQDKKQSKYMRRC